MAVMESWVRASLIICVFGFLKEFRPADAYFTQFLVSRYHNYTEEQVNQQIFPVITYSQLTLLALVFLVTDLLRYKPVIIIEGISLTISSTLLVFGRDMFTMQLMSFFFGVFLATEVAYYTYIYAKVERKHYQKVTSYTQTAFLLGRFSSSFLGQVLLSTNLMDLHYLNYITITAAALATIWSIFLPPVKQSIYFHAVEEVTENVLSSLEKPQEQNDISTILSPNSYTAQVATREKLNAFSGLWKDFKDAFTNMYTLKWCLWWALATCGYYQVYLYIQVLCEAINKATIDRGEEPQKMYNGALDAASTLIGAAAAFGCGWLRLNWEVLGEATLALCALLQGTCLIVASYTTNLYVAYAGFIGFTVLYFAMITIVRYEIAKHINEDSYGLVFGVNTFFALVLQTILTLVVAGEGGLALHIRLQFLVYGSYFMALGAIFSLKAIVALCGGQHRKQPLWQPKEPSAVDT